MPGTNCTRWSGTMPSIFIRRPPGPLRKLLPPDFGQPSPSSRAGFYDSSVSLGLRYYVRSEALCTDPPSVGCQRKDLGFRLFG